MTNRGRRLLEKAIGKDVAGSGILVNSVAPAVINTSILSQISSDPIAYMTTRSRSTELVSPKKSLR